jgi:ATP-dependent DNA ligase
MLRVCYQRYLNADEVIVEGEIVAVNPDTDEYLPFQELDA